MEPFDVRIAHLDQQRHLRIKTEQRQKEQDSQVEQTYKAVDEIVHEEESRGGGHKRREGQKKKREEEILLTPAKEQTEGRKIDLWT